MKRKTDEQRKIPFPKKVRLGLDFSAIPEELHAHHIVPYCDYSSVVALASTNKTYWQLLLPELERRLPALAVKVITGSTHTVVFTESGLYACGSNGFGQLGLGDKQGRQCFTPVTAVPEALKEQGKQYQRCQRLIGLYRQGFFSPTSTQARQEAREESPRFTLKP